MKNIRRVLSLVMALAMVMTLAIGAFAAETEEEKGIIKVEDTTDLPNHKYVAYQVFGGDISAGKLVNIVWGSAISEEGQTELLKTYEAKDVKELAGKLTDTNIAQFAKEAAKYLVEGSGTVLHAGDNEVDVGYYLIQDEKDLDNTNHSNTAYILHVIGEKTLNPKHSVPTVDKKQHTEESTQYKHDALDTYIGGTVYYELTGTLPSTLGTYEHYWFEFHDYLSQGLTPVVDEDGNLIVSLSVKGVVVPAVDVYEKDGETVKHTNYKVTMETVAEGNRAGYTHISIAFTDLHNITKGGEKVDVSYSKDAAIVATYEAILNENAVIGNPGNPNYVDLEFSNNPNNTGDGTKKPDDTGKTPEKVVFVFTYKVEGDKIQANNEKVKLEGAEFQLQRVSDSKWYSLNDNNEIVWIADQDDAAVITSDKDGKFDFEGLDSGFYKLYEIKAPDGYDTPSDPFTFSIDATLENNELKALSITVGNAEAQGNTDTGVVKIEIENKQGASLPSTGGMGTTLFYIVGAILVLTSSVLLITKKRMA